MKNKMPAKIKWAIALLLIRILGAFAVGGDTARMLGLSHDYAYYFVFAALYEQLPTIAAVILIFYNHKQPKTENTGFTLMQKWIFALVWVQHAYAFIAFALANSLMSVWTKILGGCIWLALITYLLYSAWKNPVAEKTTEQSPQQEKQNNQEKTTNVFALLNSAGWNTSKNAVDSMAKEQKATIIDSQDTVSDETDNKEQTDSHLDIFLWIFLGLFLAFFAVLIACSIIGY